MRPSPREQAIYLLSILFGVTPFEFAMICVLQTHSDLRAFGMAIASFLGASGVMAIAKAGVRKPDLLGDFRAS